MERVEALCSGCGQGVGIGENWMDVVFDACNPKQVL